MQPPQVSIRRSNPAELTHTLPHVGHEGRLSERWGLAFSYTSMVALLARLCTLLFTTPPIILPISLTRIDELVGNYCAHTLTHPHTYTRILSFFLSFFLFLSYTHTYTLVTYPIQP